jgi:hypothetical protein
MAEKCLYIKRDECHEGKVDLPNPVPQENSRRLLKIHKIFDVLKPY